MIQLASVLPATVPGPVRPALPLAGGASSFALALGALLAPGSAAARGEAMPVEGEPGEVSLAGRQEIAAPGKDLPEALLTIEGDEPDGEGAEDDAAGHHADAKADADADTAAAVASFAWFAPVPIPAAAPEPAATTDEPSAKASGMVVRRAPEPMPASIPLPDAGAPAAPAVPAAPDAPVAAVSPAPTTSGTKRADAAPELPERAEKPVPVQHAARSDRPATPALPQSASVPLPAAVPEVTPAAVPTPAQPTPAQPALVQSVAAPAAAPSLPNARLASQRHAETAAAAPRPAPSEPAAPETPVLSSPVRTRDAPVIRIDPPRHGSQPPQPPVSAPATPLPVAAPIVALDPAPPSLRRTRDVAGADAAPAIAANQLVSAPAVTATSDSQQPALDMRRQEWTSQMIERIEALRDAAPVRETRISLAPEALGKVDVSIRQEGDRVHVHFATETMAARQLIADAQPRLSELAESRGLRLGQTSVDSGAGSGAHPGQGQRHEAAQRPAPTPARAPSRGSTTIDERIA